MEKTIIKKLIKKIIIRELLTILAFAIWYFAIAFVIVELDPFKWTAELRLLLIIGGSATNLLIALEYSYKKITK